MGSRRGRNRVLWAVGGEETGFYGQRRGKKQGSISSRRGKKQGSMGSRRGRNRVL